MNKAGAGLLWASVALIVVALAMLPISVQAHLVYSCAVIIVMSVLKAFRAQGPWRLIFIVLGVSIVMRYVYWRTTSTLPPTGELHNFIPAILLYSAEMYVIFTVGLNLFIVSLPPRPRECPIIARDDLPTVDVFVPTYNEERALLAATLAAARGMDYPADKLTIWLLDDGSTDEKINSDDALTSIAARRRREDLSRLCEDFGVRYLTRAENKHAKAGNLNNGLAHSTGELIAVFDADHAPARNFLMETVGFFPGDKKLFLVQTPHFFINADPIEKNLDTFRKMPSENEMFNSIILRSLDKWNAAYFCGSAAVLRREAINDIGGFCHSSITEDCETSLALHARGWSSAYVGKPLIAGLQPETYTNFIGQRSRWAQGMIQIMLFNFPLFKSGLTLAQRFCYMSSGFHWMFPVTRAIFLVAPLLFLLFDMRVFVVSGGEFIAYVLSYMLISLLMQNYLYGSCRWPWVSELYEYVQMIHLLPAVFSVLANPHKPSFRVTAKNVTQSEDRIADIGKPFFILFAILAATLAVSIWRVFDSPHVAGLVLTVGGWNLLNLIIAGCALGAISDRRNLRGFHRIPITRRCEITTATGEVLAGTVEDVSISGAGVRIVNADGQPLAGGQPLRPGDALSITFRMCSGEAGTPLPIKIRSVKAGPEAVYVGCAFVATQAAHYAMIADLAYANADQWEQFQKERQSNIGLVQGTIWFLRMALYQTRRGLSFLLARSRPERNLAEAGS